MSIKKKNFGYIYWFCFLYTSNINFRIFLNKNCSIHLNQLYATQFIIMISISINFIKQNFFCKCAMQHQLFFAAIQSSEEIFSKFCFKISSLNIKIAINRFNKVSQNFWMNKMYKQKKFWIHCFVEDKIFSYS